MQKVTFLSVATALFLTANLFAQNPSTRSLTSFDKITISGGFEKVVLTSGASESIAIDAPGVDPEDVITEVKGNSLEVRMKKGVHKDHKIRLNITYRHLSEVNNSGSSDIEASSAIKGESFEFHSSGSGDFTGAFDVKNLKIKISGSSDMKISGKADKQAIAISGSGDVNARDLAGSEASVAISGSGDVALHVNGPVKTSVSGSGSVNNH